MDEIHEFSLCKKWMGIVKEENISAFDASLACSHFFIGCLKAAKVCDEELFDQILENLKNGTSDLGIIIKENK